MKKGDKLICKKDLLNVFGWKVCHGGTIYTILGIDGDFIVINHNLYGNEYGEFTIDEIRENFWTEKELRKEKLEKLNYEEKEVI
jgi:hypothetical protein